MVEMKTITLTVCNRPAYTKQVIDSLRSAVLPGYILYIGAEPVCEETIEICRNIDFMPIELVINPTRLGIHYNNLSLYDRVFSNGSSFNIALEDDTPIASDAIALAEWFKDHNLRDDYLLLNFFTNSKVESDPLALLEFPDFCPWGFCFTERAFRSVIEPSWMKDERGWDWSICAAMHSRSLKSLMPALSRSKNIGREGGVYCTPDYHDHCFEGHVMSTGCYGTSFFLKSTFESDENPKGI